MLSYMTLGAFLLSLLVCLVSGAPLVLALLFGLACFIAYARYKKIPYRKILHLLAEGIAKSSNILKIFVLIGMMTALWRACGTIPFIVYYGLQIVNPEYFIVCIFLLCCFVSFLMGTAFGTASTVGVICMILAKMNHINPVITGGAILSGIFFGDRCSPMSSSASLVAGLTGTNLYDNIRQMFRTAFVPFSISCLLFQLFGSSHAAITTQAELLNEFPKLFSLHWTVVLPAVIILVLTLFKLDVKIVMSISVAVSLVLCVCVQKTPLPLIVNFLLYGFHSESTSVLVPMLTGGGLFSMINVGLIVCISSSYFGILQETGLLWDIQRALHRMAGLLGRFTSTLISGIITSAFSCNQTLATMLTYELCRCNYVDGGEEGKLLPAKEQPRSDAGQIGHDTQQRALAIDLENTVILVAGLVPWSIAGSVPLATVGADTSSMLWAFYLYLVPAYQVIVHSVQRRKMRRKIQTDE